VRPIFISLDPNRDTVAQMKAYIQGESKSWLAPQYDHPCRHTTTQHMCAVLGFLFV